MKPFNKNIIALAAAIAVLATAAPGALAQFGGGGFPGGFGGGGFGGGGAASTPAPWASFKLNPKVHITLDFRNASVDAVMSVLSKASGIPIIKDPSLKTPITLMSPKPLPLNDAFALFNAELQTLNFELQKQDHFLIIKPSQGGGARGPFGAFASPGSGFPSPGGGGGGDRPELEVYNIKYADATNLATTINNLYAPTPGQAGPAFGVTGPGNPAAPAAPPGGPGGFGGRRGRFGGFGGFGAGGTGSATQPTVKASADSYSNSLIINAPPAQQAEIRRIIEEIDKPTTSPMITRVFKLQYAVASDVESVIQNILSSSQPLGRGNGALNNTPRPGGPGGFFARLISANTNQNPGGTVSSYTSTNALVVTATQENMDVVSDIIKQLDQPAKYQSTTFVYVLKNARADVVANVLNQAVGNRTTNGSEGGSLTNTGPTQNTINISSTGSGGSTGIGGTSPSSLTSNSGGGYRAGGANGGNNYGISSTNNMGNSSTSGLGDNGQVVNIRNLYGQVLFVPNIDTNSIIVVAPPEDQSLVKDILAEMDVIPEQVMIETLVVEVSLDKSDQFGVEWNFLNNSPFGIHNSTSSGSQTFGGANGSTTTLQGNTTAPQGLRYTLTAPQFSVFLNALKSDNKFNVLSTPRIFTTNNATAQINISQSLPYVTNQTVDTTGTVLYNYNFLDVGIVLTVTPRITEDGYVTMDVSQTANDFVNYTSFNAPIVNQRETETTVSVKDGETVVLGGIISDQVSDTINKVPILGDIPLLGNLFRSTSKSDDKTELLVFMTPHVVRDPADAAKIRDDTEAELGKSTQQMIPKAVGPTSSRIGNPPATPASDNTTGTSTDSNPSTTPQAADPSAATATSPAATPAATDPATQPAPATNPPSGGSAAPPAGASSSAPAAGTPMPGLPGTTMPGGTGAKALPPPSNLHVSVTNPNN